MGLVGTVAVWDGGAVALPHGFWAAVRVWLEKPQVANRRLCGAAIEAEGMVPLGEGGEAFPPLVAEWGGGNGAGQEERASPGGLAELGRLWREVRGQLSVGQGQLPPPLTPWGGPGCHCELRAVLRTLLPRGRPLGPPAPPTKELAVQGERKPRDGERGRGAGPPPGRGGGSCRWRRSAACGSVVDLCHPRLSRKRDKCQFFFPSCGKAGGFFFFSLQCA